MEENREVRNHDVPIETVFKWKQVECWKLRSKVSKLEATVAALRKNLAMVLGDKELRKEVAKESAVRRRTIEINRLNRKLHNAYESIEQLIQTKIALEAKLKNYEESM